MDNAGREVVIRRLLAGKVTVDDAALLLGVSERQVWRLRARFVRSGAAGLVHGNRGKVPANRIAPALARRIVVLAKDTYSGFNDSHLTELLAEREGVHVSRKSVQRILRAAGLASPRRHRAPRYRARRERRSAPGMLLQLDGSRHRWFGAQHPYLTLLAIQDDATGEVLAATFRAQEDAAGYLAILREVLARRGAPLAVYSDRHGIFWRSRRERESQAEELAGEATPTQLGRALAECGAQMIFANSPQAKGRVERLWGTFQDRLVGELRLAGVTTIAAANEFLARYLTRHNARFACAPRDPLAAWRSLPPGRSAESICCFKYARMVGGDNTVRLGGVVLQLPPRGARGSWANELLECRQYLDGSWSVHAPGGRELARSATPVTPPELRAERYTRAPIAGVAPLRRGASSPWRRGFKDWHPVAARRTLSAARRRSA